MASKMVNDRARREMSLRNTLESCHTETIAGLCERFAPLLEEGEDLAGALDLLLGVLERCLDERFKNLDRADSRNARQRDGLAALRRERDRAARELRRILVDVRATLVSLYGRETAGVWLGLEGLTAKAHDPVQLLAQAHTALRRLRNPDREPPRPRQPGISVPFDSWRKSWIEALVRGHAGLERALGQIHHKVREGETTQLSRDEQLVLIDRDLSAISNLQKALLVLGMRYDLARTVWSRQRPKGRPRRRKEKPIEPAATGRREQVLTTREPAKPEKRPARASSREVRNDGES